MAANPQVKESPLTRRWREQKEAEERSRSTPIRVEVVRQPKHQS